MTRPAILSSHYSGLARGREEAVSNPFTLISRPLHVPAPGEAELGLSPAALIADPSRHPQAADFERMIKSRKAFVLGGTAYICRMGLLPSWYKDKANRTDAMALIANRGWTAALVPLTDRDGDQTIFRMAEISNYFNTLPPLDRETPANYDRAVLTPLELWSGHRLRLRKVVEMLALTEAVTAWRFRMGESGARWAALSGRNIARAHADYVLDHMWIEPVIYAIAPKPRGPDIEAMLADPVLTGAFTAASGQSVEALYWLLSGAVGKHRTVTAAAAACNAYYGPGKPATQLISIRPDEFVDRANLVRSDPDLPAIAQGAEDLREPGPDSVAPDGHPEDGRGSN